MMARHPLVFLALALLASSSRPAAAQTLIVDAADGNTPYALTADATYSVVHVGETGTGEIDHSAGTLTQTGSSSDDGIFIGYNVGSHGTYNLSGTGVIDCATITDVGTFGTGVLNQTGGTANFDSGFLNSLGVGVYNGSTGTYNQSAGTTTASFVLLSNYAGSTGTYNLNAGTLSVGEVLGGVGGGTASTFNLNGGTLQAANEGNNLLGSLTRANVRNNGAVIDANGFNTFIPQTLSHSNVKGDAGTDGGLTVEDSSFLGGGSVTVFGSNTYTGRTLVNSGALFVDNNTAKATNSGTGTGNVFVNLGAWLGGSGSIGGSVTIGSDGTSPVAPGIRPQFSIERGTLTPGNSVAPTATLTIHGNLTLTPGLSMLEMDLGDPASVGSDLVKVGGNLSIGGDLQLTLAAGYTPNHLQTFTLIDVSGTGTQTGTFENATIVTPLTALYTDANGNEFLITYDADADENGQLNDVTATFLGVPEPSTWALLALGGAGLLGMNVLRRRA